MTKTTFANGQRYELTIAGHVVSSGNIEFGDLGEAQLSLPTRCGDGVYIVHGLKINGEIRAYLVGVDALEHWVPTHLDGEDRPWPPSSAKKTPARKTLSKRTATAA